MRVFHVLRHLNKNYTTNTGTITLSDKYNYVHHGQRENLSLLKGAMLSTYDNTAMSVLYCYSDHSILSHHYYIHVHILSLLIYARKYRVENLYRNKVFPRLVYFLYCYALAQERLSWKWKFKRKFKFLVEPSMVIITVYADCQSIYNNK